MILVFAFGWFAYDYVWSLVHLGRTGGGHYALLAALDAFILAYVYGIVMERRK